MYMLARIMLQRASASLRTPCHPSLSLSLFLSILPLDDDRESELAGNNRARFASIEPVDERPQPAALVPALKIIIAF